MRVPATTARERRAQDAAEAQEVLHRQLEGMTRRISALRIDFQRFLVGDLDRPPHDEVEKIRLALRRLRGNAKGVAERFRLNTLEAQLASHHGLFERRMRQKEKALVTTSRPEGPNPDTGIAIGSGGSTEGEDALYKRLYLHDGTRQPKVDLERFRATLRKNVAAIRAKTGCDEIVFRVAEENGKLKLKAKPIRPSS